MSVFHLTDAQRRAVGSDAPSTIVLAGAGSGKTRVLVERYLHLVSPRGLGLPVESVVAITFTERAAQEMKSRIWHRIEETGDGGLTEADARLRRDVHHCRISTIHAFCADLLRRHALDVGVPPDFAILDEGRARSLMGRTVREFVRSRLDGEDPDLGLLVNAFGGNAGELLREALSSGDALAGALTGGGDSPAREAELARELDEALRRRLGEEELHALVARLDGVAATRADDLLETKRRTVLTKLDAAREREGLARRLAALEDAREACKGAGNCGKAAAWADEADLLRARSALSDLARWLDDRVGREPFDLDGNLRGREVEGAFRRVLRALSLAWRRRKDEAGCLDFDDLLDRCVDWLEGEHDGTIRCRQIIGHVLVDEFQDTNETQRRLIYALTGDPARPRRDGARLFVVGDPQQSIYRFRGADCSVFHRVRADVLAGGGEAVVLEDCFRMGSGLTVPLDRLFSRVLGRPDATPHDPPHVPLRPRRGEDAPPAGLELLLFRPGDGELFRSERIGEVDALRHLEAERLAGRLREIVDAEELTIRDPSGDRRPLRWGDVAILLRVMTHVSILESALQRAAIPFVTLSARGFFDRAEIVDVLNVLRCLAQPWDDVALAALLRSPMIGLDDLALLRLSAAEGRSLRQRLDDCVPETGGFSPLDGTRLAFARDLLARLGLRLDRIPLEGLVEEILDATAYEGAVLAGFGGRQKLRNLRHLVRFLAAFRRRGLLGLHDFLDHVEELRAEGDRAGDGQDRADRDAALRISSIHGAKGLEFPLVVVPELHRKAEASRRALQLSRTSFGLRLPKRHGDDRRPRASLAWHELAEENRLRDDEEDKRLFYVAATRARDRLLLSGALDDEPPARPRWMDRVREAFGLDGSWIYPSSRPAELPEGLLLSPPPGERVLPPSAPPGESPSDGDRSDGTDGTVPERARPRRRPFGRDEISTTELLEFARCPRLFELKRLRGLPDRLPRPRRDETAATAPDAALRGELLHRMAELWNLAPADLPELIAAVLHEADLDAASPFAREAEELLLALGRSPTGRRLAAAREERRECAFLLDVDGTPVSGIVDRLFLDDAGWWVLDFKSNRLAGRAPEEIAARYHLQLATYVLAATGMVGRPPAGRIVYFFDAPESAVSLSVTPEDPTRWRGEMRDLIRRLDACHEGLRRGDPDAFPRGASCSRSCPFRGLCQIP